MSSDQQARPDEWDQKYQLGETPWDRGTTSPFLGVCLDLTEPGSSILVPGCGAGHEVVALAALGYRVTGLDLSDVALSRCRESLEAAGVKAELYSVDALDWESPQAFDAIYEQTFLCAVSPSLWEPYAQKLEQWLRPEGRLFAAFMQTGVPGGPPFDCPIPRMQELFSHPTWNWPEQPPVRVERGPKPYELGYVLTRPRLYESCSA